MIATSNSKIKYSEIHFVIEQCSLGQVLIAQSNQGICSILLGDDPDKLIQELQNSFPSRMVIKSENRLENTTSKIIQFIENPEMVPDLKLDVHGTQFQQQVWNVICKIPPGSTASYTEIAHKINSPNAARAVANACASNILAIAIPCHRVVRSNGDLSGYRWGLERKEKLLKNEKRM